MDRPSLEGVDEEVKVYINQLESTFADLSSEVDRLTGNIDKLHQKNDNCLNRFLILQERAERSRERVAFYNNKLLCKCTKNKDKKCNLRVQPIDDVKGVRYRFGKRRKEPSPTVVEPIVTGVVDKRNQSIPHARHKDQVLESENHKKEKGDTKNNNKKPLPSSNGTVSTSMDANYKIVVSSKSEIDEKDIHSNGHVL